MKKIAIIISVLLVLPSTLLAALDPQLKECMQRGYETSTQSKYCIFPDNSRCTIEDFNSGTCGQEFFTEEYCVEEGVAVWDEEKCCPGTEMYLQPGVVGQATCQNVSTAQKTYNTLRYDSDIWLYAAIASGFTVLVAGFLIVLKKNKK